MNKFEYIILGERTRCVSNAFPDHLWKKKFHFNALQEIRYWSKEADVLFVSHARKYLKPHKLLSFCALVVPYEPGICHHTKLTKTGLRVLGFKIADQTWLVGFSRDFEEACLHVAGTLDLCFSTANQRAGSLGDLISEVVLPIITYYPEENDPCLEQDPSPLRASA